MLCGAAFDDDSETSAGSKCGCWLGPGSHIILHLEGSMGNHLFEGLNPFLEEFQAQSSLDRMCMYHCKGDSVLCGRQTPIK